MIQVGDDASLGGYLVEGVKAGARQVGAAGVLLLHNDTASWRRHRHLWAHFQSANKSLAIALTVEALLHAGHNRFVSIPSAVMVTACSKGRDGREYGEYVIERGRMSRGGHVLASTTNDSKSKKLRITRAFTNSGQQISTSLQGSQPTMLFRSNLLKHA